nr:PKD domain-containing protein [Candidatus Sigynarchaeum springense]
MVGATPYEGRVPRWHASTGSGASETLSSPPPVAVDGSIAIRARWERLDRTQEPFDTATPGRGYFWMDQNLYVRDAGTYVILYRPWGPGFPYLDSRNDVFAQSNPNWADRGATIDGPAMCYIERMTALKTAVSLEWIRQVEAQFIDLFASGNQATDGLACNTDFYQQNDVVVFPNRLESRNNIYPTVALPVEILDPNIGTRFYHAFGNLKVMQFDPAISTSTSIFLGPGATMTDPVYGATMAMLENQQWVNERNFPHYYGIQQLGPDGLAIITRDYHPWDWMNEVPAVPSAWYGGGTVAKMYTLDGVPSNDASSYTSNSDPMADGSTREYHMWWDYTGTDLAYREQWTGTSSWRAHLRTRCRTSTTAGQGYQTEYVPTCRTPRNQQTNTVTNINYPSDWFIISVPGAGDVWVYQPTREIFEFQSHGYTYNIQPPAAVMQNDQATIIKDSDMKEVGLYAARLTNGGSVIPFTMTWTFNNWGITNPTNAMLIGKREWVRNRFSLDSIFTITQQTFTYPQISTFGPVPPAGLFYKAGDSVVLDSISTWSTNVVSARTAAGGITSSPAVPSVDPVVSLGEGLYRHRITFNWIAASQGDNVGPNLGTRGDYYWVYLDFGSPIQGTASCGLFWDTTAPTPATFSLPAYTTSPVVVIDWSASKGSDNSDNTFPPDDNAGIDHYQLYRNGSLIGTIAYGRFTYIDDNGGAGFANGTLLQYQLRTVDKAGNYGTSPLVFTCINGSISNPGTWNAQFNGNIGGPGPNDNPTAAHGNVELKWNSGAPYSASIESFEVLRSTNPAAGFVSIATGIGPTTYSYTINWESPASVEDTYWYKLRSHSASGFFDSAPMPVIYDKTAPLPAAISWSYGPTYTPSEKRVPIDITGSGRAIDPGWYGDGEPMNTGSGVWRYVVYRMVNSGSGWPTSWTAVATVDKETMESDVWYHSDITLTNGYTYRYMVQAQDYAAPFPSLSYPSGMANSSYIEFTFQTTIPPMLRVLSVNSSVAAAAWLQQFEITVGVGNLGTIAGTLAGIVPIVTRGGIDVSSAFTIVGPSPTPPIQIGAGGTQYFTLLVTASDVSPTVEGEVLFSASCTWTAGSHAYCGAPAAVNITSTLQPPLGVRISSIARTSGSGTLVGGMSFNVRVTFFNNQNVSAANVDATLTFGGYPYLSSTDPAGVSLAPYGGTGVQDFIVTISPDATTFLVTMGANWTATGGLSGDQGSNFLNVAIQEQARVSITSLVITGSNGAGPYVGGMSFTLTVTFSNTGGTGATNVDATIDDGAYAALSWSNPASVTVNAGSTNAQVFTITSLASSSTAFVTISVTWAGFESISGRVLSGNNQTFVRMQARASVAISGIVISGPNGAGPYVAGMSFTLTVAFSNTGGTGATNVDATLTFGSYTHLTSTGPAAVIVNANSTNTQAFSITAATGATTAAVTITATWTGTEAISSRAMSGDAIADTTNVSIQSPSSAFVDAVALNATASLASGWVLAEVNVRNTGGTAITGCTVTLTFNSTTSITQVALNSSTGLNLSASGEIVVQFRFQIPAIEPVGNTIRVQASFSGTEAITGRAVSNSTANFPGDVRVVQSQVSIFQEILGGRTVFVQGESFVVHVTIDNSLGNMSITGGSLSMEFGGAAGFSSNSSVVPSPIAAGTVITVDFLVTTITGAATSCSLRTHLTGNNPSLLDVYTQAINIMTTAQARISITNVVVSGSNGAGPYLANESFTITVTFTNTGGTSATVGAILDADPAGFFQWMAPATVFIANSSIATQAFWITVLDNASVTVVHVNVTWSGIENSSGRVISGDSIPWNIPGGIRIGEMPIAMFSVDLTVIRVNDAVTFIDESEDADGHITSWSWTFGDGTSATTRNAVHAYRQQGSYWITLTITDDDGYSCNVTRQIVVLPLVAASPGPEARDMAMGIAFASAFALLLCGMAVIVQRKRLNKGMAIPKKAGNKRAPFYKTAP